MAELEQAFGGSFGGGDGNDTVIQIARMLANSIIGHNFPMHMDLTDVWVKTDLNDKATNFIHEQVKKQEYLQLDQIKKGTKQAKMLPYFISSPKVAYFRLCDFKESQIYLFYITDKMIDAF